MPILDNVKVDLELPKEGDPRWRRTSYGKTRTTLYLDGVLWQDFKTICVREGQKMSFKIERWIKDYVEKHKKGNPQQELGTFNDTKAKAYVAPRGCAFCHRPATCVLRFKPNDTLTPLCEEHYRLLERSPNYEKTSLTIGEVK